MGTAAANRKINTSIEPMARNTLLVVRAARFSPSFQQMPIAQNSSILVFSNGFLRAILGPLLGHLSGQINRISTD